MQNKSKPTKVTTLNRITAMGVVIIAIGAFALSFDALRNLAVVHGVNPNLSWVFPISLDLAILIYSMASMVRRWRGLSAGVELTFVAVITAVSIALNTSGVIENDMVAKAMGLIIHALPPILLAASVEAVTRMMSAKRDVRALNRAKVQPSRKRNRRTTSAEATA